VGGGELGGWGGGVLFGELIRKIKLALREEMTKQTQGRGGGGRIKVRGWGRVVGLGVERGG